MIRKRQVPGGGSEPPEDADSPPDPRGSDGRNWPSGIDIGVAHRKWLADGGSERVAAAVGETLDKPIHSVAVDADDAPDRVIDECDSRVRRRLIRLGGPPRHVAMADAWIGMDALDEYDVVVTSGRECLWWTPGPEQAWVAYIHSLPHRQTHRYASTSGWRRRWAALGARLSAANYRRPDVLVANSDVTARRIERYLGIPTGQIRVIYPPVDVDAYAPDAGGMSADECGDYWLVLGRISEGKRVDEVAEAFAPEEMPDLKIAGRGPEMPAVAEAADGAQGVELWGYVGEASKRALLADAQGVIHAADGEPFGISPVEALASGTPLLVADAGFPALLVNRYGVGDTFDGVGRRERVDAIREHVKQFSEQDWPDAEYLTGVAARFGPARFADELGDAIAAAVDQRTSTLATPDIPVGEYDGARAIADGGGGA